MSEPATNVTPLPTAANARTRDLPLLGHLEELRKRLFNACGIVGLAFIATYHYSREIFHFLTQPLFTALEGKNVPSLYFTSLSQPFLMDLKVAFLAALFFSSPFLFWQLWRFVAPGLRIREKQALGSLVLFSSVLFVAGLAFAYYVFLPLSFRFFLSYADSTIQPILTIGDYLDFCAKTLLSFGLVFQMPLIVGILTLLGVVDAKKIIAFWRYAIVIIAFVSAALTPPDVASMMFMMAPLCLLYALSIGVAALLARGAVKKAS